LCSCSTQLIVKPGFSQMTIDAGPDTVYCAGLYPEIMYLGTNISIENGVEPYFYTWECKYDLYQPLIFTASDFLDDTTIATPYFKDWIPGTELTTILFYLHITDNEGASAVDSINVGFSGCVCTTETTVIEIHIGDSIWFNAGEPAGKYVDFYWEPSYGLNNPDSSATWCKPEVNTSYSMAKIDTFGCICSCPVYDIRVYPVGVGNNNHRKVKSLNIRQLGNCLYYNNPNYQSAHFTFYSINGRVLNSISISEDNINIGNILHEKGIYIVKVSVGEFTEIEKIINY